MTGTMETGLMDTILFVWGYRIQFAQAILITIGLSIAGMSIGTFIGLGVALLKISEHKLLVLIGSFYTWVFRGIPLLVQLFVLYYGLPGLGINLPNYIAAIIGLSLCSGAYIAEIMRAGIQSIEKGQMEAALSLGMSRGQAMRRIIIPQTYRRLVPPMANEFITLLKDTSLASVITMVEILRTSELIAANTFRTFEMYVTAAICYLFLTTVITSLLGMLERKLAVQEEGGAPGDKSAGIMQKFWTTGSIAKH
ncbi:MAG: amino acid ABC transporter permease [Methylocystaceae bacterium]